MAVHNMRETTVYHQTVVESTATQKMFYGFQVPFVPWFDVNENQLKLGEVAGDKYPIPTVVQQQR